MLPPSENYKMKLMNSQNSYKSVKKGEMDLCESEVVSYISMQGSQLLQDTVIVKEIA
jgi:hypothetical protein